MKAGVNTPWKNWRLGRFTIHFDSINSTLLFEFMTLNLNNQNVYLILDM